MTLRSLVCDALVSVAENIMECGFCVQSEVFKRVFASFKYNAEIARRKLLQMPLVCIIGGDRNSGKSLSYLLESQQGLNYQAIQNLPTSKLLTSTSSTSLTKEGLRDILSLAQSSREKELVRYTAFVAGRFSQTSARRTLGLEGMSHRAEEVERCIKEAKEIRESIQQIAED